MYKQESEEEKRKIQEICLRVERESAETIWYSNGQTDQCAYSGLCRLQFTLCSAHRCIEHWIRSCIVPAPRWKGRCCGVRKQLFSLQRGSSGSQTRISGAHSCDGTGEHNIFVSHGITEKYHDYVYGAKFDMVTDNNPLTYVFTTAKLDATGQRWLAEWSNYNC